ncbi:DUF2184 domain-containing protein [Acinetobacter courvalinii]|uniref:hypothetical protein n=1 Tax=Acinetobacter courvalinii TaxID=280147 RepID=UPI0021D1B99B|nr:hypothetical protein [Acinetobacter courvalinii]MCU4576123.1 DUF2184 domain-containing protein [Acinetobacter courvalinii]
MSELEFLASTAGVYLPQGTQIVDPKLAMDAQSVMATGANAGIPAFLANYMDPKVIEILVAPMKAAEIIGESKKGDWTTETATFPVVEATGETSSYGDFNDNGSSGVNVNFPMRQSYHYQTTTAWGERQLAMAGLAGIDWATRTNIASILTLNKYQNKTYFYGVDGLQCYGLLNDPALTAPITPTAQWSLDTTDALTVYNDVSRLFRRLIAQCNGTIDQNTPMTLVLSPAASVAFNKTNQYNVNVTDQLKKNYPNLEFQTAPEYATATGELVQLIVKEIEGQETATCAFTEKLRAHNIVVKASSYEQKKSQGTFGTVIFRPFAIVQMLGV